MRQKRSHCSERVKSDEVQQQRCDFWLGSKDVKAKDIICIGETGIWQGMERSVSRGESGKKAFSHRTCFKSKKHDVVCA